MNANTLTWNAYRDGDRYIIGPTEWQTSAVSLTYGIAEAWGRADAKSFIIWARAAPATEVEGRKRSFDTYDRFETACDRGDFGAAW